MSSVKKKNGKLCDRIQNAMNTNTDWTGLGAKENGFNKKGVGQNLSISRCHTGIKTKCFNLLGDGDSLKSIGNVGRQHENFPRCRRCS